MWQTQIALLSAVKKPPIQAFDPAHSATVMDQLNTIRAMLREARGQSMNTNQISEQLGLPSRNVLTRMARLYEGKEVKKTMRGPSDPAIWTLIK